MAIIYNSKITKRAINDLNLATAREKIPNETSDKIVLTYPLDTPNEILVRSALLNNATSATIFTPDKEFFITSASMAYIKDATSTATLMRIRITQDGTATNKDLIGIPHLTLTAGTGSLSQSFIKPIKVDGGSSISLASDTNVANIKINATITGFYKD